MADNTDTQLHTEDSVGVRDMSMCPTKSSRLQRVFIGKHHW